MLSQHVIRPLGPLSWLLDRLGDDGPQWSVIGALSPEERCLAASRAFRQRHVRGQTMFIRFKPLARPAQFEEATSKIERHADEAHRVGFEVTEEIDILCQADRVGEFVEGLVEKCGKRVLLDVTTMPKRFFFPLLSELCDSPHIKTLLVSNTAAGSYDAVLSEDATDWETLPGFCSVSSELSPPANFMIGVGYQTLNIAEILERYGRQPVQFKLLLPVPSLHPGHIHNWKFINDVKSQLRRAASARSNTESTQGLGIEAGPIETEPEIVRVPNHDVSLAFDRLVQHSQQGQSPSLVMAPFGPKPMSVAMCLLGIARREDPLLDTEIGYTQPRIYSPTYSTGSGEITACCVKLNGRNLYSI